MKVKFMRLSNDAKTPSYATDGSCGLDLYASQESLIKPGSRAIVSTGISMSIPKGYYGQVCGRSGLFAKQGLQVVTGYVDSDYRGAIGIMVYNTSDHLIQVAQGQRCAQLIIHKYPDIELIESACLDETARGEGGYGSTGA